MIAAYQAGSTIEELAVKYEVTTTRIYQIFKARHVALRTNRISEAEEKEIANMYSVGMTHTEIIKRVKRGSAAVCAAIDKHHPDKDRQCKINRSRGFRKYGLNEEYFDQIDTEDKAWIFGFITADGNLSGRKGSYILTIKLQRQDRDILEIIKSKLGYGGPIRDEAQVLYGKEYHQSVLQISSVRMIECLKKHGLTPAKSLTVRPWSGPGELMRHYWRGVIDGDGCLSRAGDGWQLNLCGNEFIVTEFGEYCHKVSGTNARPYKMKGVNNYQAHFGGAQNVKALVTHFWHNATISLPRKWEKAKLIMAG